MPGCGLDSRGSGEGHVVDTYMSKVIKTGSTKMQKIFWLAQRLVNSQGVCVVELFSWFLKSNNAPHPFTFFTLRVNTTCMSRLYFERI